MHIWHPGILEMANLKTKDSSSVNSFVLISNSGFSESRSLTVLISQLDIISVEHQQLNEISGQFFVCHTQPALFLKGDQKSLYERDHLLLQQDLKRNQSNYLSEAKKYEPANY